MGFLTTPAYMDKYTDEAIKQAMQPWVEHSGDSVKIETLTPRFFTKTDKTMMFVIKKYPLFNISLMPSHMFMVVDGFIFHPGNPSNEIFSEEEDRDSIVVGVYETCIPCGFKKLHEMLKTDKTFNIMTNNCQIITGQSFETMLLLGMFSSLALYVVTGWVSLLIIAIGICCFVIVFEQITSVGNSFHYSSCKHIKSIARATANTNPD